MNDALIIQMCNSSGEFFDSMRLTYQRHATYALSHKMDYWHIMGDMCPDRLRGGWDKVNIINKALEAGYEKIFWIDADACIVDMQADIRDGLIGDIGACIHDANGIPKHHNVGVLFIKNGEKMREFFTDWWNSYPGTVQWMEQGAFNDLLASEKYKDLLFQLDDRYNATVNVNMVQNPVIIGWHGVRPLTLRYSMMRDVCKDDYLNYRVK